MNHLIKRDLLIGLFLFVRISKITSKYKNIYQCTSLSPMTDAMRVKQKNRRQNVAGSRNTTMPMSTVPIAPIPVHIG